MSLEAIRIEIQERQGRIQSLYAEHQQLSTELNEVYAAEQNSGLQLSGSTSIPPRLQRIRDEIKSLQSEIENLVDEAREESSKGVGRRELNPLEALGMAALLWADGRISEEEYDEILDQARRAISSE